MRGTISDDVWKSVGWMLRASTAVGWPEKKEIEKSDLIVGGSLAGLLRSLSFIWEEEDGMDDGGAMDGLADDPDTTLLLIPS